MAGFAGLEELTGEGYDLVRSQVSYILRDNFEALELTTGYGDINGTGNALGNQLTGNEGANILDGKTGADTLRGGAGDDVIIGGLDNDLMYGEAGRDTFVIRQESVGRPSMEADRIYDIDFAGGDRVDLSHIDANANLAGNQAFTFVSAFTGVGGQATLIFDAAQNVTYLRLDVNGDRTPDYMLRMDGDHSGTTGNVLAPGSFLDAGGGWIL